MRQLCFLTALVGVLAFMPSQYAASQNLINNGGFENPLGFDFSDTSNFNGFFGGPGGVFLEAFNDTGAPAFAGAQALELTIEGVEGVTNGFGSFTGHTQTVAGVSGGDELIYSVYARNNDSALTGTVEFRIEYNDITGAQISNQQINLESLLTDEYQFFDIQGTAPVGTASVNTVLAIATFVPGTEGIIADTSVLFDEASLTLVAIPEPSSMALLCVAGASMVIRRRRRA